MSTTVEPQAPQPAAPGRAEFNLTEFDAAEKAAKVAAPSAASIESTAQLEKLQQALRTSEEARMRAIAEAEAAKAVRAAAPAAPAPAVPTGPKDLTFEELAEIQREDPTKALTLAMEQTRRRTTEDLNARLGPMASATYASAEMTARAKYAEDFEAFGDKITEFIDKQIPVAERAKALSDPTSWGTLIDYLRGQNIDRVIDYRGKKAGAVTRERERQAAPPSLASGATAPAFASADSGMVFDSTTIEIMENILGVDDSPAARAEWVKWHRAGRTM
jgi:hypothetical protein